MAILSINKTKRQLARRDLASFVNQLPDGQLAAMVVKLVERIDKHNFKKGQLPCVSILKTK